MWSCPRFNALAGTSSILNRAVVDNSADDVRLRAGYYVYRYGLFLLLERSSQKERQMQVYGIRFVENKIQRGVVRAPIQKG